MTNVEIQLVSFSYPTDKILKTSNDFVTVLNKKKFDIGWRNYDRRCWRLEAVFFFFS